MMLIDTRPEYPPEWDDADAKEECDPFDPLNLAEFIGNLDHKIESEHALLIKLRVLIKNHEAEFKPILDASCEYWTETAEVAAVKEFESGECFDED